MVFLGNKRFGKNKRFGQNGVTTLNGMGNGSLQSMVQNAAMQDLEESVTVGNATLAYNGRVDAQTAQVIRNAAQGVNAMPGQMNQVQQDLLQAQVAFSAAGNQIPDSETIQQMESELGVNMASTTGPLGNRFIGIEDSASGAQALVRFPPAAPAPAPVEEDICTFPAQSIQLQRTISITNTAPQIMDVQTDVCGNVVSFTESMTRNMVATEWNAISGLQGGVNGIGNFSVGPNGVVALNGNPDVRVANSLSKPAGTTQVTDQRFGGKRVHPRNQQAVAFGAAAMSKWKGA